MNLNAIDVIFFTYIFIGLYMMSLLIFIYIPNRKKLFDYPKGKPESVSIVMPCYNESSHIGKAIESLVRMDYPKNMLEIIIVDDKSTDNSVEIINKYARKYKNVKLIVMKNNFGRAAGPTNVGIRAAKGKYIAVADSDSVPDKDALIKMIGFLQEDKTVGAVTCSILAKNPKSFWQKMQDIEYAVIAFTRKLLDFVDSVYVTPGPFALYRKAELVKLGLFDENNMTQDIEIVWRYIFNGYKARMCLDASVYSETPSKIRPWWRQRIRWNIGGFQTLVKYKSYVLKKGMLGVFIIPLFALSLFLGLFGFGLFVYLISRRFLISYLSTKYAIYANTAIVSFQDLSFMPSVLNYFGAVIFLLGITFTLFGISKLKDKKYGKVTPFSLLIYSLLYLSLYPLNLLTALYKFARGTYSW
jgi:cellulose synthase/poly-beta-1,6-N-acetylglucosamine synthase-like glycosyltransferase